MNMQGEPKRSARQLVSDISERALCPLGDVSDETECVCVRCAARLGPDSGVAFLELRPQDADPDSESGWHCEACTALLLAIEAPFAIEYAQEECKLTKRPHQFDESCRYAPTPEEYEAGMKEAHTENSVRTGNRHHCTNYDELIRDLDRNNHFDRLIYAAIRDRIDEILDVAETH